jgi:hypothetical protein
VLPALIAADALVSNAESFDEAPAWQSAAAFANSDSAPANEDCAAALGTCGPACALATAPA